MYKIVLKYYGIKKIMLMMNRTPVLLFQMDKKYKRRLKHIVPVHPDNIIGSGGCTLEVDRSDKYQFIKFNFVKEDVDDYTLYYELDKSYKGDY